MTGTLRLLLLLAAATQLSGTSTAAPSASPTPAPTGACVLAIDGGNSKQPAQTCLDPQTATAVPGSNKDVVGAQCCASGKEADPDGCNRYVSGDTTDAGCVGGKPPRAYTFAQTQALCSELGLTTCAQSCTGAGCNLNNFPVWTHMPCDCPAPPPPSPPSPPLPPSPPPPRPPRRRAPSAAVLSAPVLA